MPPTIKKTWKWLVVTVYRAESLPVMDGSMIGDVGFDPLGLYTGATADKQRDLELKELNNGRLAMMAVAGYVAQEFIANAPVA